MNLAELCSSQSLGDPRLQRYAFMAHMLTDGNETRVVDAYGLTEFPGISSNGEIAADVEVKLAPVWSNDDSGDIIHDPNHPERPCGEILVRRKGRPEDVKHRISFWKRPDLTTKWLPASQGGWFKTGDIGELDYRTRVAPNQYHEVDLCWATPSGDRRNRYSRLLVE